MDREEDAGLGVAFPKLTIRHDRYAASALAFLHLACALICLHFLEHAEARAHWGQRSTG